MSHFSELLADLEAAGLSTVAAALAPRLDGALDPQRHGDLPRWWDALHALPQLKPRAVCLDAGYVSVGSATDIDAATAARIEQGLRGLMPWRKGPFKLYGVHIDTEWRSDLKWDRLRQAITPLSGRRVLDVGCGSGYHCWRMRGEGARLVLGIDPALLFNMQYRAIRHFTGPQQVHVAPLGIQDLPAGLQAFDSVFSMGVLYHRRSPIDHLLQLRECLRPGGELVLETLVVEGGSERVLVPGERYAKMRNVWFIPSPAAVAGWLERCGYRDVRLVDVGPTTSQEQRRTDWMRFESLADFLDPADPSRTVEGYPAPRRAVLVARLPA